MGLSTVVSPYDGGLIHQPIDFTDQIASAVGAVGQGRLRYNNTTKTLQVSLDGAAYTSLATAAGATLQTAYAGGTGAIALTAGKTLAVTNANGQNQAVITVTQSDTSAGSYGIRVDGAAQFTTPAFTANNDLYVTPLQVNVGTAYNSFFGGGQSTGAPNGGTATLVGGTSGTGAGGAAIVVGGAPSAGVATNQNAGGVTISSGASTGTGIGSIVFKAPPSAGTGTGANAAATIAQFSKTNAGASATTGIYSFVANATGGGLATTAIDGFTYIGSCAGTPTGVPTAFTGAAPLVIDSTNNVLYFRSGGAWNATGGGTPTLAQVMTAGSTTPAYNSMISFGPFGASGGGLSGVTTFTNGLAITDGASNSTYGELNCHEFIMKDTVSSSNVKIYGKMASDADCAFRLAGASSDGVRVVWTNGQADGTIDLGLSRLSANTLAIGTGANKAVDGSLAGASARFSGGLGVNGTTAFPTNGNTVLNNTGATIAQNATDGFVYLAQCATGAPSGVPTAFTGARALVVGGDNHLYFNPTGSAWVQADGGGATPTLGAVVNAGNTVNGTSASARITWTTGGTYSQASPEILGPTDQNFHIAAASAGATSAGRYLILSGGPGGVTSGDGGQIQVLGGTAATNGLGGQVSILGGTAAAGNNLGGSVGVGGGTSTGSSAGPAVTITGGTGGATGDGGGIQIVGGSPGGATGNGAAVNLTSGAGGATSGSSGDIRLQIGTVTSSGAGGTINILGAAGANTGAGSNINLTAGASGAASSNGGGAITLLAGAGGGTLGTGGGMSLTAGAGTAGNSAGGVASLVGGAGQGSAAGGAAQLTGGLAGATGVGGASTVTAGAGGATSGTGGIASMVGGAGTAGNAAGGVSKIIGGAGQGSAAGGAAQVTGGSGGATGAGGAATITSGAGGATSGASGAITLQVGTVAGAAGNGGNISLLGVSGVASNSTGSSVTITCGASVGSGIGGAFSVSCGSGDTNIGGGVSLSAGSGGNTGQGGNVSISAGAGGGTSGTPGSVDIIGGAGGAAGIDGSFARVRGGAGNGSGSGGQALLVGGGAGATGPGGLATVTGGAGVAGPGGLASLNGGQGVGTDQNSGGAKIFTGLSSGAGVSDILMQSGFPLASGTTAQTASDRDRITSKVKNLTNNTATTFVNINLPTSNSAAGVTIFWTVIVSDAAGVEQVTRGAVHVALVNKAGTVTAGTVQTCGTNSANLVTGTDAITFGTSIASTTASIQVTSNSSLTITTHVIEYRVLIDGGPAVTSTPQ